MKFRRTLNVAALSVTLATLAVGCADGVASSVIPRQNSSAASSANNGCNKISLGELVEKVRAFTSSSRSTLRDPFTEETWPVAERILQGFEQNPPRQIQLVDGTAVAWGWQNGQAQYQSLAILDDKCGLRIVGAANYIHRIYSASSGTAITTLDDYAASIAGRADYSAPPSVDLFAANQEDVDAFYPLVRRWLQANMMGFNTRCADPTQSASCRLAAEVQIPVTVHARDCASAEATPQCALHVPTSLPKSVPEVDDFKQ